MDKLLECRNKIDEIDTQIIKLYEKRMKIVKEVAIYKINNNMQVLDSSREAMMFEKNLNKITNVEFKKYYSSVLNGYLTASKEMQKEIINNKK